MFVALRWLFSAIVVALQRGEITAEPPLLRVRGQQSDSCVCVCVCHTEKLVDHWIGPVPATKMPLHWVAVAPLGPIQNQTYNSIMSFSFCYTIKRLFLLFLQQKPPNTDWRFSQNQRPGPSG